MNKLPITSEHLKIMQQIVAFIQEIGWDIDGLEITRYTKYGVQTEEDEWKGDKRCWRIGFSVAPRDEEELLVRKKETA